MMNCEQTRQMLASETPADRGDAEVLREHLQQCAGCREFAVTQQIIADMRSLPVPPPEAGFEQRVMSAALSHYPEPAAQQRSRHHVAWFAALAASVVLAVTLTLQFAVPPERTDIPSFTVSARANETRIVDVVLDSRKRLSNATLTVTLDSNLQLENRPHTRELRWQADIQEGGNHLSLPVQWLGGDDGNLVVTLEHDDHREQIRVRVKGNTDNQQGMRLLPADEVNHG